MSLTIEQYHERFDQRRIDELLKGLDTQPPRAVRARLSELSFQLAKALNERDELQQKLDDLSTPHSCRPGCTNPVCVMRRERDEARACLREAARLARTRLAELGAEWLDPDATPSLTDAERAEGMENDSRITHLRICVERWRKAAGLDEGEGADKGV